MAMRVVQSTTIDFKALVEEGQQPVMRYLLARTHSPSESAELLQETFVRAYCAFAKGDRPRYPLPWLLAIARNVYVEMVRKNRYRREMTERLAMLTGPGVEIPWEELVEQRIIVSNAVDTLPNDLREPVLLHYFAGLSLPDVARHLEITPGALRTRLWRARQTLRGELEGIVNETKKTRFTVPKDLAKQAQRIVEQPPLYESIHVALQVGGQRPATDPLAEPLGDTSILSFSDIEFAIERLHMVRLAGDRPLSQKLDFFPNYEFCEHPQALDILRLIRRSDVGNEEFLNDDSSRIMVSDGWWLGTNPRGHQFLKECADADLVKWVWFTITGYGATHDEQCERPGAYEAVVTAMASPSGTGIGPNWFIIFSKRSVSEIAMLAETVVNIRAPHGAQLPLYPYHHTDPVREEALSPEPEDVLANPLPQDPRFVWRIPDGFWENPEQFTEASWIRQTLESTEPGKPGEERTRTLQIWITPALDVYTYDDRPRVKLANLRTGSAKQVYQALANTPWPPAPPTDQELAQRYGNAQSRKLYHRFDSMRHKWLRSWQQEHHLPWLPWAWRQ